MNDTAVRNNNLDRFQHRLFLLACVASTAILFIADFPPMVDLPQHAAQIVMIKAMLSGQFAFANLFELQVLTPYWLGYSIVLALSCLVDTVLAIKLTVALAMAAFPISADRFLRAQNGYAGWSWLFIPTAYGFAFEWGLLNFLIAIPPGFFFLARISRLGATCTTKDLLWIAAWCHLLFFAHVLVLVLFLLMAVLIRHAPDPREWFKRILPFFSVAPLFAVWFVLKILGGADTQGSGPWSLGLHRFIELLPNMVALPPASGSIIPAMAVCAAALLGHRLNFSVPKTGPFLVYVLWMLLGPNFLFGTYFVYNRFTHIGLPLLLLAATPSKPDSGITHPLAKKFQYGLIAVLSLALYGHHFAKARAYADESAQFSGMIARIPADQRVLGMVFSPYSAFYTAPVYLHYPVWNQVRNGGVTDFNFAYFFPQVVRYKMDQRPPADPDFVWNPGTFDWNAFRPFNYRYYLVKNPVDLAGPLFPAHAVKLVHQSADWWLYQHADLAKEQ